MNDSLVKLAIAALPVLGAAFGYMVRAKLIASKTTSNEIDNANKIVAMWQELMKEREEQNKLLKQTNERLEGAKAWLESELKTVVAENERLRDELASYKKTDNP